jgi:hypothetical protein
MGLIRKGSSWGNCGYTQSEYLCISSWMRCRMDVDDGLSASQAARSFDFMVDPCI